MKLSLQLRLGQQLTMTPQLQQAIRLLQLSTLDLQAEVQELLEANPMLEEANTEENGSQEDEWERPNDVNPEGSADRDLTDDAVTSKADLAESTASQESLGESDNRTAEADTQLSEIPEDLPVDSNWDDVYDVATTSGTYSDQENMSYEAQAANVSETLQEQLLWQLRLTPFSDTDRLIAESIIDAITDDGYLSVTLDSILEGFQEEMPEVEVAEAEAVLRTINAVISRDPSWLEYYGENIQRGELDEDQVQRAEDAEEQMIAAAVAEAAFAAAMWNGDVTEARNILDEASEATGRIDALLSGWQSVWLGAALEAEGDIDSAHFAYRRAMSRLGNMLVLPRGIGAQNTATLGEDASFFARNIDQLVGLTINEHFERELARVRTQFADLDGASSRQMEEATRVLGEILGFVATRPDNDVGTGPDVLWHDESSSTCVAFELKTDKDDPATYWKKDITQGHDHLSWVADNYPNSTCLGLLFVGPDGSIETRGNPSDAMWCCLPTSLVDLRSGLFALIADLRRAMPLERSGNTQELCDDGSWGIGALFERLKHIHMRDMAQRQA